MHGDERGFRTRGRRIRSSGDYKHRPPVEEHEGLRRYHYSRSRDPIGFALDVRIRIVRSFVLKARSLGLRTITCSCGEQHLHSVVELVDDYALVKREIGKCKQRASYDVRDVLQGNIWSEGGQYKRIHDVEHLHNAYDYIRTRQESRTVVWSHREGENWIDYPEVGVIIMDCIRKQIRAFAEYHSDPA